MVQNREKLKLAKALLLQPKCKCTFVHFGTGVRCSYEAVDGSRCEIHKIDNASEFPSERSEDWSTRSAGKGIGGGHWS